MRLAGLKIVSFRSRDPNRYRLAFGHKAPPVPRLSSSEHSILSKASRHLREVNAVVGWGLDKGIPYFEKPDFQPCVKPRLASPFSDEALALTPLHFTKTLNTLYSLCIITECALNLVEAASSSLSRTS